MGQDVFRQFGVLQSKLPLSVVVGPIRCAPFDAVPWCGNTRVQALSQRLELGRDGDLAARVRRANGSVQSLHWAQVPARTSCVWVSVRGRLRRRVALPRGDGAPLAEGLYHAASKRGTLVSDAVVGFG